MEFSKLPVAKRTRSGSTRFIEEEFKRFKSYGTVAPVLEVHVVAEVEHVMLDEDDDDEGLSRDESGKCKSRKCRGKSNKGKVELDHKDSDSDLIVMEDCNDQEVHDDSDFVEIFVVDKGEGEEIEKYADDDDDEEKEEKEDGYVREDMPVNLESYDSLSGSENFSEYNSDESYRGDSFIESDYAVNLDNSSSFAESEDEGNNISDDDYEIECRVKEKNDGKRKGNGKLVEGRGRKNVRGKKEAVNCRFKDKVEIFDFSPLNRFLGNPHNVQ